MNIVWQPHPSTKVNHAYREGSFPGDHSLCNKILMSKGKTSSAFGNICSRCRRAIKKEQK